MANAFIHGRVVSYDTVTGSLVVTPLEYTGDAGSYDTWTVALAGKNGTSGAGSTSGTAGESSSSGTNGSSGTSGASGSSGTSGISGSSASSGTTGTSGTSGVAAVSGVNGPTGPQGATGPTGPQGAGGSSGASGGNGATGAPGGQGPTGGQGPQGFAGPTGPTGAQGPAGPTGTSASYNQDLNSGASTVRYAPLTGSQYLFSYSRYYTSPDAGTGLASNVAPPFMGFGFGWATDAAVGGVYFYGTSTRDMKKNIQPMTSCAMDIINATDIVTFKYDTGLHEEILQVGFIAEDTPEELATFEYDKMDLQNVLGVVLKCIQEIDTRITILENQQ
jgi:hypothetical protein